MKSLLTTAILLAYISDIDAFQIQPLKAQVAANGSPEKDNELIGGRRAFLSSFGAVAASVLVNSPKSANAFATSEWKK